MKSPILGDATAEELSFAQKEQSRAASLMSGLRKSFGRERSSMSDAPEGKDHESGRIGR